MSRTLARPHSPRATATRVRQALIALLIASLALGARPDTYERAPAEEPDEFHFVVLGDAQFDQPALFNRVIDQTRQLRPAFVIQVGDMIEGYNSNLAEIDAEWQRFAAQVEPLAPIAFIPVPGNHDTFGAEKVPDAQLESLYESRWGPLYFAFDYKNALIVGLNTDTQDGLNQITGAQWIWLEETLAASEARHKFLFMHRPPMLMKNAEANKRPTPQHMTITAISAQGFDTGSEGSGTEAVIGPTRATSAR